MDTVVVRTLYHVFIDGQDYYEEDEAKAWELYRKFCQEYDNVRLWTVIETDGGETEDGDCLARQGEWPW